MSMENKNIKKKGEEKMKEKIMVGTMENSITRKKRAKDITQNAFSIGTKKVAWIPVELLVIKQYQRNRQKHITSIAENWDNSKCNVLLVSYDSVNGVFNVMDGQHRAAAARMRGVEYLVCEIFQDMTISKEALYFVSQNINTKKLSPFDTFNANQYINGEDETDLCKLDKEIKAVCEKYNVDVKKSNAANCIKSVSEARSIVKRDGKEGLSYVIEIIQESNWDSFTDGYAGDLMNALGKVYFKTKGGYDERMRLIGFFKGSNPTELVAIANNNHPNLGRRARLNATIDEIIAEPEKPSKKVTAIA